MSVLKVIISGGGTGGHVFPAIAIADALKAERPDSEVLFVGALGRMEMERVPKAGYRIEGLPIAGFQRRFTLKNLGFPFKLMASLRKARAIVKKFEPAVAIGVGGYASGPLLRMAASRGIPTVIQEQNSFPGVTNRLLAKRANRICVAYPGMERWFDKDKLVLTGNPVRKQVLELNGKRSEAARFFGLSADKPTLLVVGGSLGARTINRSMEQTLEVIAENDCQLIWQSGKAYAERAREVISKAGNPALVTTAFIDRMDLAYAMADAVVSRAGAMSVSELTLAAKACILVPSPNVAEDHQTKNAKALADRGAAILIADADAPRELPVAVGRLLSDKALRQQLASKTSEFALPDAAQKIAMEIIEISSPK